MSVIDIIAIKEKFIFSKIVHFLIFCRLFKLYFILILSVNVATNNYRRLKQNNIFFGRQNVRNSTFLDDFALIEPAFVLFDVDVSEMFTIAQKRIVTSFETFCANHFIWISKLMKSIKFFYPLLKIENI